MAGFGSRTKPSEGVRKHIYVVALALQDATQKTSVLATFDLSIIGHEWGIAIADKCQKEYGLTRDRLILNSSHSHSGPTTLMGDSAPSYTFMTPEPQREIARQYTREMVDKAVQAVGEAIRNMSPASLAFEQGLAGIGVNRRRVRLRSLPGPVDQDVPVLAVRGSSGDLRAIVVGYACHATSLADYQISADWPGYAKEALEAAHPGAIVLFVQDCGADANPLPRYHGEDPSMVHYSVELAEMHGKTLAAAADLVLHGKMKPVEGPLRTAYEAVDIPIRPATREQVESWLNRRGEMKDAAKLLLERMDRDGKLPDHIAYPVEVWRFGRGLGLIVLSGETVADYALRLKGQYGWDNTWVAGYSNDWIGYIPSLRVLREGGYEGGDANTPFLGGPFGAAVEENIVEKVGDLMKRTAE
jgi:hypothetical protein